MKRIAPPLTDRAVEDLRVGDRVLITGRLYVARDAAHKRLVQGIEKGGRPPIDLRGAIIYYMAPTPPRPGQILGAAGPTTSIRMDSYLEPLLKHGLKATIGKGYRSRLARELMKRYRAVYLAAIGGAGAYFSDRIKSVKLVAYEDLGPEALLEIWVEDFPAIVANDVYGRDLFEEATRAWRRI